jgi:hypothetical protein
MLMNNEELHLLGYNTKDIPMSDIVWLNKQVKLSFNVKIKDSPLPYAAITDIDFFTEIDNEVFQKEASRSFASVIIKDNIIWLSYNDFKLKKPKSFKLLDIDDQWHKFEITISRENLWCPNRKCQFEDCLHLSAELIEDDLIGWGKSTLKKHRRVSIKIDELNVFNFNYLTSAKHIIASFGNNTSNLLKDPETHFMVLEAHSKRESSMILKNISLISDEDEIEFSMKSQITDS